MKKRILAMSLAAILSTGVCFALTACGEDANSGNPVGAGDGTQVTQEEWKAAFEVFGVTETSSLENGLGDMKENLKVTVAGVPSKEKDEGAYEISEGEKWGVIFDGSSYELFWMDASGELTQCIMILNQNNKKTGYQLNNGKWEIHDGEDVPVGEAQLHSYRMLYTSFVMLLPLYEKAKYNSESKMYELDCTYREVIDDWNVTEPVPDDILDEVGNFKLRFENKKLVFCESKGDFTLTGNSTYRIEYGGQKIEAPI